MRFLPPAYVVRREGNSFTLFVCPHGGEGGPGTPPLGGTRVRYPPRGVPGSGTPLGGYPGQVPPRGVPGSGTPPQGYPGQVPPRGGGVTRVRYPPGGCPGTPPGGCLGTPPGGYPGPGGVPRSGGGTRVGQQKEYSLHGGRYASCVHAGGLSCSWIKREGQHVRRFMIFKPSKWLSKITSVKNSERETYNVDNCSMWEPRQNYG